MHTLMLLFSLFAPPVPTAVNATPVSVTVNIENVEVSTGTLWIGIYESEEDFLNRDLARLVYHRVTATGSQQVVIDNLLPGKTYAVGVFHDQNDNGELDTNFFGLPAEPWAFSRPLQSWLRKPRFAEMSFVFEPGKGLPQLTLN